MSDQANTVYKMEWVVINVIYLPPPSSPTVPPPVPQCSTIAVYNGSSNELANIVVNWHQAEVSSEYLVVGVSSSVVYVYVSSCVCMCT